MPLSLRLAPALVASLLAAAACSPSSSPTAADPAPSSVVIITPPGAAGDQASLTVVRNLTDALNRGDSAAARALFAPTARFDSVGRIYPDRDAIFDRFLDPEVIGLGGRYTERATRTDGDRTVVEYDFTTRSGGSEHFTYAYRLRNGLITDVVGRYV